MYETTSIPGVPTKSPAPPPANYIPHCPHAYAAAYAAQARQAKSKAKRTRTRAPRKPAVYDPTVVPQSRRFTREQLPEACHAPGVKRVTQADLEALLTFVEARERRAMFARFLMVYVSRRDWEYEDRGLATKQSLGAATVKQALHRRTWLDKASGERIPKPTPKRVVEARRAKAYAQGQLARHDARAERVDADNLAALIELEPLAGLPAEVRNIPTERGVRKVLAAVGGPALDRLLEAGLLAWHEHGHLILGPAIVAAEVAWGEQTDHGLRRVAKLEGWWIDLSKSPAMATAWEARKAAGKAPPRRECAKRDDTSGPDRTTQAGRRIVRTPETDAEKRPDSQEFGQCADRDDTSGPISPGGAITSSTFGASGPDQNRKRSHERLDQPARGSVDGFECVLFGTDQPAETTPRETRDEPDTDQPAEEIHAPDGTWSVARRGRDLTVVAHGALPWRAGARARASGTIHEIRDGLQLHVSPWLDPAGVQHAIAALLDEPRKDCPG